MNMVSFMKTEPLLSLLAAVLLLGVCCVSQEQDDAVSDPDVEQAFNPDVYDGYQRRFTVEVAAKSEECYFLDNVQVGHKLNFHFMVVNVGKSGQKLDISSKIKGPDSRIINFQSRKSEGKLIGEEISTPGNYEICFNNRFSMMEPKKVFWEVEVEGQEDDARQEQVEVDQDLEDYLQNAKTVKRAVAQVRTKVSRMKHQQWRIEQNMKRDSARAEAVQDMVDRWSVVHVFVVVGIGIAQVVVLRNFFNVKAGPHRINART